MMLKLSDGISKPPTKVYIYAQEELANCYRKGIGISENTEEAVKWYRKVAESVDTVQPDPQEELYWCHEECYWGLRYRAQKTLSDCYSNGEGVTQDPREAAKWAVEAKYSEDKRGLASFNETKAKAERVM